jgi:hypothetical protein
VLPITHLFGWQKAVGLYSFSDPLSY